LEGWKVTGVLGDWVIGLLGYWVRKLKGWKVGRLLGIGLLGYWVKEFWLEAGRFKGLKVEKFKRYGRHWVGVLSGRATKL
jgi:hypothetical protein